MTYEQQEKLLELLKLYLATTDADRIPPEMMDEIDHLQGCIIDDLGWRRLYAAQLDLSY